MDKTQEVRIDGQIMKVLRELRNPNGIIPMYINCLARLRKAVLFLSDDLGMSDTEAIDTIRVLEMLTADLRVLSGEHLTPIEDPDDISWDIEPELPEADDETLRRNIDRMFADAQEADADDKTDTDQSDQTEPESGQDMTEE